MKILVVMLAATLLAIGVAQAQSDAPVGAPIDLHPPSVPSHTRTAPAAAAAPSSIFEINPTAGPSQATKHHAVVHKAAARKHKKPVTHPAAVHAKATHKKTTPTRTAQIRTPQPTMTYTRPPPVAAGHTKTTHTRSAHRKTVPATVANYKIPQDTKAPRVGTTAHPTTMVHAKPVHRVARVAAARPPAKKPAHRRTAIADTRREAPHADDRQRSDALNDLSASGYADYRNFHRVGSHYVATVDRNGGPVTLVADPRNHQVTTSP